MKKKVYFIISSALQIIVSLFLLLNSDAVIQAEINAIPEAYSMFPVEFQQQLINSVERSGKSTLIIIAIITTILNLYVLDSAICNKVLRNKGKIIGIMIFICCFSLHFVNMLLSFIGFIILLCSKRKNPEDYPIKEKKKIPKLEYVNATKKEFILGIVLVVVYFIIQFVNVEEFAYIIAPLFYILTFVLAILCFKDRLKRDIIIFKENRKAYFQYIMPRLGIMYVIYIIANLACIILSQQAGSINQSMLEQIPLYITVPLAIIWAPIVEETIFRGVLRNFIKNSKVYIIVSGLIFGLIHTLYELTVFNAIILAIPYAILGAFFAYMYTKTENFLNNILLHSFHNIIAIFLPLLLGCAF